MPRKKAEQATEVVATPAPAPQANSLTMEQIAAIVAAVSAANSGSTDAIARAMVEAINIAKPKEKKNAANRTINNPWTPKDGAKKLKLKRKAHQHGVLLDEALLTNEQIALFNKLRPGTFLNGSVRVVRRKDRGIDLDYPIKTASQRLRLVNQFGIRTIDELLERCIYEAENPVKEAVDADGDLL